MLDESFQTLRSLGVTDAGIVFEVIRVVDESEVAHGFLSSM
jgi:hypothetical protein